MNLMHEVKNVILT